MPSATFDMEFAALSTRATTGRATLTLSFDPAFIGDVSQFAQLNQRFAVVPIRDNSGASLPAAPTGGSSDPPPSTSKRVRTPAEYFYLEDCHDPEFQAWCGCILAGGEYAGNYAAAAPTAKEAIKLALHFRHLSEITQPQVNAIRRFYHRGGMLPGLAAHLTEKGLL